MTADDKKGAEPTVQLPTNKLPTHKQEGEKRSVPGQVLPDTLPGSGGRSGGAPETRVGGAKTPEGKSLVAGWLVVISGPDRGKSFTLDLGKPKTIGRGSKVDISIEDSHISSGRGPSVEVSYDNIDEVFIVVYKGGTRARLVDALGQTTRLDSLQNFNRDLLINEDPNNKEPTILRLVPLCGPDFSWEDPASQLHSRAIPPTEGSLRPRGENE